MPEENLSYNEAVYGIISFIEVAIHTILYVRHIYPADLFERRKLYDTAVYQSRHPVLNEYITGAMRAVAEELAIGNVDKVVVVIKDKDQTPYERFIFAVDHMVPVDIPDKDISFVDSISTATLGKYFRSFLVKLHMIESQLGMLALGGGTTSTNTMYCAEGFGIDDASFAIILELRDNKAPTVRTDDEPPPWMPASYKDTTAAVSETAELSMLRAVNTGIINLAMAVQESDAKLHPKKTEVEKPIDSTGNGPGMTSSSKSANY